MNEIPSIDKKAAKRIWTGKVVIVPFECGVGATTFGSENGPYFLYESGVIEGLAGQGLSIEWQRRPRLYTVPSGRHYKNKERQRRRKVYNHLNELIENTKKILERKEFPITMGGDHALAAASIRALAEKKRAHKNIGVLLFDAHPDLNDFDTTDSGSLHGMWLAALTGLIRRRNFGGLEQVLDGAHVCVIGARDIDPPEWEQARKAGVTIITMDEVKQEGIQNSIKRAWKIVSKAEYRVIEFDLDCLKPSITGLSVASRGGESLKRRFTLSTGTPVPGGFEVQDILDFLRKLHMNVDYHLLDIVEFNPELGDPRETAALIGEILKAALPKPAPGF